MVQSSKKSLAPKWWNEIRKKMRQTPITYTEPVLCPDCGTSTHLMEGKFGRFYKCRDYYCEGTIGARLDGSPRKPKVDSATHEAQREARDAIRALVTLLGRNKELLGRNKELLGRNKELLGRNKEFSILYEDVYRTFEESLASGPCVIPGALPKAVELIREALGEEIPLQVVAGEGKKMYLTVATTTRHRTGFFLRGRSKEEAVAIAKAATKVAVDLQKVAVDLQKVAVDLQYPCLDRLIEDPLYSRSVDAGPEPEQTR